MGHRDFIDLIGFREMAWPDLLAPLLIGLPCTSFCPRVPSDSVMVEESFPFHLVALVGVRIKTSMGNRQCREHNCSFVPYSALRFTHLGNLSQAYRSIVDSLDLQYEVLCKDIILTSHRFGHLLIE